MEILTLIIGGIFLMFGGGTLGVVVTLWFKRRGQAADDKGKEIENDDAVLTTAGKLKKIYADTITENLTLTGKNIALESENTNLQSKLHFEKEHNARLIAEILEKIN